MTNSKCVLVCAETVGGTLATISAELLNCGAKLAADLKQPLSALVIGPDAHEAASAAIAMGADTAMMIAAPPFLDSTPDYYVSLIGDICQKAQPSVVIMAQGEMGRDVAPRLAARMSAAVTMDCTDLAVDPATMDLLVAKPVYGGNAVAVWASSHFPHITTLRPGSVPAAKSDTTRKGEATVVEPMDSSTVKTRLLQAAKEDSTKVRLEDARIIVAGGAGVGGPDGLKALEELAEVLGGIIGVTRVPCDLGWVPISMEIGQTGHIVSPDLYIAVGISGAPQHITGCQGSKIIVAINRDSDAHIFKESDFGAVCDYRQILPAFIERLKSLKSG